ncbi:hypothetical protein [Parafrankia sp. EUN1f]|uniref:hypothetical protein n=1 Tax=Parafrankia sp. EUN1f TaxID=102897 RepID=UPI0012FA6911|nr:hypothetical protein [Parafrankia sp. EUN1f]
MVASAQLYWTDLDGVHTEKGSVGYVESIYSPTCRTIKGHAYINAPYPDGSGVLRVEVRATDGIPPIQPQNVVTCSSSGVPHPECFTQFISDAGGYLASSGATYDNTYGDHSDYRGTTLAY